MWCIIIIIIDYYWSLLYSAILCSRADSLRSHVILHEWIAFYSAFFKYPPKWCTYSVFIYVQPVFTPVDTCFTESSTWSCTSPSLYRAACKSDVMYLQPVFTPVDRCFMESSTWSCTNLSLHQVACSPSCEWLTFWTRDLGPSSSTMVSSLIFLYQLCHCPAPGGTHLLPSSPLVFWAR